MNHVIALEFLLSGDSVHCLAAADSAGRVLAAKHAGSTAGPFACC